MRQNVERERRFLVRGRDWASLGDVDRICQGYLSTNPRCTVRVRIRGARGFLTVKGRAVAGEKPEIECEIPLEKARAILEHSAGLCAGAPVVKTRRTIHRGSLTWEVDEFAGANAGLVIAEVEYTGDGSDLDAWHEQVDRERPAWIGPEITADPRYANSRLAERPFAEWPERERADALDAARS